jgi:hypothetical protein
MGPRAILGAVVKRKIPSRRWESNPRTPHVPIVTENISASGRFLASLYLRPLQGNNTETYAWMGENIKNGISCQMVE